MKFTYYGHSAFGISDGTTTVLVDPWFTGNPTNTTDVNTIDATTILLTHAHGDHVGDTVGIATRTGAKVITTPEIAHWLGEQGVENLGPGNFGGTVAFEGGSAKFVPAWHTSGYQTPNGLVAEGIPAGFVVRYAGKTIYFAGDTGLFLDMQLIGEEGLDIAVLPIGDNYTMGPTDAVKAAKFLKAGTIIPAHYNTFPLIAQDPEAFKSAVESETEASVIVIAPGDSVEL